MAYIRVGMNKVVVDYPKKLANIPITIEDPSFDSLSIISESSGKPVFFSDYIPNDRADYSVTLSPWKSDTLTINVVKNGDVVESYSVDVIVTHEYNPPVQMNPIQASMMSMSMLILILVILSILVRLLAP